MKNVQISHKKICKMQGHQYETGMLLNRKEWWKKMIFFLMGTFTFFSKVMKFLFLLSIFLTFCVASLLSLPFL